MNTKILTLRVEDMDKEDLILAVEEMLRQLKEGFTSGQEPFWGLEEVND
ncbi:MAG: hypothetical protein Q8P97_02585 [bacterium]|nr:hypothetical protein [bacterium]